MESIIITNHQSHTNQFFISYIHHHISLLVNLHVGHLIDHLVNLHDQHQNLSNIISISIINRQSHFSKVLSKVSSLTRVTSVKSVQYMYTVSQSVTLMASLA